MKTFRLANGNVSGKTVTVGELREALRAYPDGLPVMTDNDGLHAFVNPWCWKVEMVGKGHVDDNTDCLVMFGEGY